MKKILALLAVVLGVVSCQTEPEGLDVNVGGEVETTVCVSLPEATRANSAVGAVGTFNNVDWNTYTVRYTMQIFDQNGRASEAEYVAYKDGNENNNSVTFPVRLVPNRDYNFVVWADIVTKAAPSNDLHYNLHNGVDGALDLTNITLNNTWVAMDETRDAYTGFYNTEEEGTKYSSSLPINITLTRPFAKLRVITTDMVELGHLGIEPDNAVVTYTTKFHQSFNACNGEYGAETVEKAHSTAFEIKDYADFAGTAEESSHKVLFTDYFFADDSDVVKFVMDVNENGGALIKSNNFSTDIAVQRNYLTTISGNILTDGNNVKVDVEDAFANAGNLEQDPYYYETISSEAELLAAIENGGEYIVISDIDVTGLVASTQAATRTTGTTTPTTTTINLNGKTITLKTDLEIAAGKTVIINNDPVDNAGDELGAVVNNGGKIINYGTLNIEGGEFGENTIENNGKVNVNSDEVHDNAIENGENAIVGSFIYNIDQLKEAVKNAVAGTDNEFTFAADITGEVVVIQKPNVKITINGADHKFDGKIKVHSNSNHYTDAALTIKNVNFVTSQKSLNFIEALEVGAERYSTNITAEDCTFTATGEAVNTAVGLQIKASKWANVLNCTATDMHSLLQANSCDESVVVKGCTINGKGGVSFTQVKAATVEGTTITALEYGIRFNGNVDNYGIVVKDNNITAAQPFIVRKMTGKNNTITLEGENTFTTEEDWQIVITNGADDAEYVKPTGTYTLTGAEAYSVFPEYATVANAADLAKVFALGIYNISLAADITLTDAWTPVGNAEQPWYGVFDGKNHKISGLTVEGVEYAAFISHSAANSTVKNLTLENVNLNSTKHAAGVVCVAESGLTLENVKVSGTIVAASYAGGIMHNGGNATIKNCENSANVTASRAGGIASWTTVGAVIENVVNYGNITGEVGASGIAHGFAGSIKNATNYGAISSADVEVAAGIAGVQKAASTYEYCYNYGKVTSTCDNPNASAAGILGQAAGSAATLKYCANYGEIKAEQSYAAGIAYSLYGSINASYCYNNGSVFGADGAGAIAPKAQYGAGDKASYCLNAGTITSNGTVYQGSNNNTSSYYYINGELRNVSNNAAVTVDEALNVLNGGDDSNFFEVENGIIVVK